MKLVKIDWIDTNFGEGWVSINKARTHRIEECITVGFIVKRNFCQISVAQSISKKGDSCDSIMSIPIKCIKSIREIE